MRRKKHTSKCMFSTGEYVETHKNIAFLLCVTFQKMLLSSYNSLPTKKKTTQTYVTKGIQNKFARNPRPTQYFLCCGYICICVNFCIDKKIKFYFVQIQHSIFLCALCPTLFDCSQKTRRRKMLCPFQTCLSWCRTLCFCHFLRPRFNLCFC